MLDGASNCVPWMLKIYILMEEVDLQEHVEKEIPESIDSTQLATHWKKETKAKKIINSLKDHFISHIAYMKTSKKMFDALFELNQNDHASRQMVL